MRTDQDIQEDVEQELQWDPDLDATNIAVSVKDGVVTLAGFVKSLNDKYEAESATKRVAGVRAVANDLELRLPAINERPDPDIARDAITAITTQLPISFENIKVTVRDGWFTLEGRAEWQYQKNTAENAVRRVRGVKGVSNMIALKPRAKPAEIRNKIQEAFKRNAEVDANRIVVETNGSEVILSGTVRSWLERHEAERVAWSAPGVTKVEDRIVVAHPWPAHDEAAGNASARKGCPPGRYGEVAIRQRAKRLERHSPSPRSAQALAAIELSPTRSSRARRFRIFTVRLPAKVITPRCRRSVSERQTVSTETAR
jgi:osmotically-inducible protein OsmY